MNRNYMRAGRAILETPRLILREFVAEDLADLAAVLGDAETMHFYPAPLDRNGLRDWIERNRQRYRTDGFGLWAMLQKPHEHLIGDCGLINQTVGGVGVVEIGYHVRRDLWGNGFATEAARACLNYGFARLPVERLVSLVRPENAASCRVAEKNGMTVSGQILWHRLPHLVYAIARQQAANLSAARRYRSTE